MVGQTQRLTAQGIVGCWWDRKLHENSVVGGGAAWLAYGLSGYRRARHASQ